MKKLLILISFLVVSVAQARGDGHSQSIVFIDYVPPAAVETTVVTDNTKYKEGIASAIAASQHQFNYGIHSWQGSVAVGTYDSETAISVGLAKRFNRTLINGSVSKNSAGFAVNFTF